MNKKLVLLLVAVMLLCTASAALCKDALSARNMFSYVGKSRSEIKSIGPATYDFADQTNYIDYTLDAITMDVDYDFTHGMIQGALLANSDGRVNYSTIIYYFGLTTDYARQFEDAMAFMGINPYGNTSMSVISSDYLGNLYAASTREASCAMYAIPALQVIVCGERGDNVVGAVEMATFLFGDEARTMEMLHEYYQQGFAGELEAIGAGLGE